MLREQQQHRGTDGSGGGTGLSQGGKVIFVIIAAAGILLFVPNMWAGLFHVDLSTHYWQWAPIVNADPFCQVDFAANANSGFGYSHLNEHQRAQCDAIHDFGGGETIDPATGKTVKDLSTMRFIQEIWWMVQATVGPILAGIAAWRVIALLSAAPKAIIASWKSMPIFVSTN